MNLKLRQPLAQPEFLPISREELQALGWDEPDVLLISGDAYVDHPAFGTALLGRWLVEHGYRVLVLAQPRWYGDGGLEDFKSLPRPRLFAGITAGAVDSMLAHHTAFRKKRSDDAYTPGGKAGARPNRASIVYTGLLKQAFPGVPVVLGGIEASLRRVSHYDFWSDSIRRSILLDSKADLLLCGMSEHSLLAAAGIADFLLSTRFSSPEALSKPDVFRKAFAASCRKLSGAVTALTYSELEQLELTELLPLPAHEEIAERPAALLEATLALERAVHQRRMFLSQRNKDRFLLLAPFAAPLQQQELDRIYALPFSRLPHPSYTEKIPAWEMIRTSVTTHRGCGGGCSFCSLALHQGRSISSRSKESVLAEVRAIATGGPSLPRAAEQHDSARKGRSKSVSIPRWAGSISDLGGPSANMWKAVCTLSPSECTRTSCMYPKRCPGFKVKQLDGVRLLHAAAGLSGVRHVRVASGVRFDLALEEPEAMQAYTQDFTGGQLKVAPEHISPEVLRYMRKPPFTLFEQFISAFYSQSKKAGKQQYIIPYLMSAFPGCTEEHMLDLKHWLKKRGWSPKQVQCFIPTPGTVATAMYHAGQEPGGKKIFVAKSDRERLRQHYILLGRKKD